MTRMQVYGEVGRNNSYLVCVATYSMAVDMIILWIWQWFNSLSDNHSICGDNPNMSSIGDNEKIGKLKNI